MLANEQDPPLGGKAGPLRELQAAGFHVPEFAVLNFQNQNPTSSSSLPAILDGIAKQLGFPLAVRSSASLEDGPIASFAGQFQSYLNLSTRDQLITAVRDCQQSMTAPAVSEYCQRSGIPQRSLQMQIIVQKMVQAELAGVAFTVNPLTGSEDVVVEAIAGLGQQLLAGRESALPNDHPLLKKHMAKIVAVARQIERHFGSPQDIEFAIEKDVVYVLQARPITRIGCTQTSGEWTNANFRDGGVSSTVCTPLMWSLYDLIWNESLKGSLREVNLLSQDFEAARLFFSRPYWNLGALKQCLRQIPGFVEKEFDTDLGVAIQYQGDGIRTSMNPRNLIRFLPTVFAVRRYLRNQTAITTQFVQTGYDAIDAKAKSYPFDIDAYFQRLVEQDYFALECNYFRTIFTLSLTKMDFKRFFPDAPYAALMSALPKVNHTAPLRTMQQMVDRGETDVSSLLDQFRHHYHLGLDICHPRWDEDPQYVELLLQQLPDQKTQDSEDEYLQTRAEIAARIPFWKRRLFQRKLDRLRHLVWLREEMRDLSNRMYHQLRCCVQEIACRRNLGDDIFFMSYRQILDDDRSAIDRNRDNYERYRNFHAPNEIGKRFNDHSEAVHGELKGLAASGGTAQGTACLAVTVKQAMQIPSGSILVCRFTDPGWTPALGRAAAVVTETGGMLSHTAVICREFGIPAVLAVSQACQRISNGSQIIVHGDQGLVELLEK